ncbi:MAG: hypothetical protein EB015_11165 [Methylocystaceae bacterium]|nr:hypothetical protein [Methylocystaceae bacterium]
MMRLTRIYLLYAVAIAWMNFPSNAFAAACSFPLTQTVAQSCDGLTVNPGDIGAIYNAGTITSGIDDFGTITDFQNTSTGQVAGIYVRNIGLISTLTNNGEINGVGNAGTITAFYNGSTGNINSATLYNFGSITNFTNYGLITAPSYVIYNVNSLGTLINGAGGVITGDSVAILNYSAASINLLSNSGLIQGGSNAGIYNHNYISSIVNDVGGVIDGAHGIINFFPMDVTAQLIQLLIRGL